MKSFTTTATVLMRDRLNNSINGNPRYDVLVRLSDGSKLRGKTASDHQFCYNMPRAGDCVEAIYHTTAAGNVIFTNIEAI